MLGKRRDVRPASGRSGLAGGGRKEVRQTQDTALHILRLAHDGRGVARDAHGKTVFVERALAGERVEVAVHRTRKRFDEAHVRELLASSEQRVEPSCPHFGQCGGCDLQHMALTAQRRHKTGVLEEQLAQQGLRLDASPMLLVGAGEGYRRRARLGVKVDAGGRVHLGFRARGTHHLMDIERCTILTPRLAALLAPLRRLVATLEAPRAVGHLELLESETGLNVVVRQLRDHPGDRARWRVFAENQGLLGLAWLAGREAPSLEWLTAKPDLFYRIAAGGRDLELAIEPSDFLQVNAEVNQRLVETALHWLELGAEDTALDLFAGVGNLSLALATAAREVVGVEGSPAMVERLAANAARNSLASVSARQADLTEAGAVRALLDERRWSLVLLDPPREGAEVVARFLAESEVPRILYVSCDPATLSRDSARLVQGGYRIVRAAVADMFSQTAHMESMLLFERTE